MIDNKYIRTVKGKYRVIRLLIALPLISLFFALPWLSPAGESFVLININERYMKFFDLIITIEDFNIIIFLFIFLAAALFFVTNLYGRIWCGYSCPQTLWTFGFLSVERLIEGKTRQRKKLDQVKNSAYLIKKTIKHFIWIIISLITALTIIGYFKPPVPALIELINRQTSVSFIFWLVLIASITYINAGWLRERFCSQVCPYSRFQSVMYDNDTVAVTYAADRGEPRGKLGSTVGSCVDCSLCVQVCPTGIDIRDGSQIECINCSICVDACDSVMSTLNQPLGLIAHTSNNTLSKKKTSFNPRRVAYGFFVLISGLALSIAFFSRDDIEASVERDRSNLYTISADDEVVNSYSIKIKNKRITTESISIHISPTELKHSLIDQISLSPLSVWESSFSLSTTLDSTISGRIPVKITLHSNASNNISVKTVFIKPAIQQYH